VAAFDPAADPDRDPVFRLMVNTFVTMFRRRALLDETIAHLRSADYHVVPIESFGWESPAAMHSDLARILDFPSYYGHNLDALNDCLRDMAQDHRGWPAEAAGLVLVLLGYDSFAARHPAVAQAVLDIIATQARTALVFGRRLFCLVQSDDPDLRFEPVGATPVMWNDAEWLDAHRR